MKVQLIKDERYPTYYVEEVDIELYPWIQPVDWPVNLDYKIYREVEREYNLWQQILSDYYKEVVSEETGPWCTINSPSATITSSTLTS